MFTTAAEVLTRWIDDSDSPDVDNATFLTLIGDAEDEVLRRFPKIQERIDAGALTATTLKRVIASVVIRAWKVANSPFSTFSETTGPFSQSATLDSSSRGGLGLTEQEIAILSPRKQGVFMATAQPRPRFGSVWGSSC